MIITQRISIDPITLLEVHGKIEIFLDEQGNVANSYFQIPELRGFECFVIGRPIEDRLGWRGTIFFVADNLIGNKKHLKQELLPALIEWRKGKLGLGFSTEVSINLAGDDELMKLMHEAGFDTSFIGVETPDEDSLTECNKKQNRNRGLWSLDCFESPLS